jgi:hypothetical protein
MVLEGMREGTKYSSTSETRVIAYDCYCKCYDVCIQCYRPQNAKSNLKDYELTKKA